MVRTAGTVELQVIIKLTFLASSLIFCLLSEPGWERRGGRERPRDGAGAEADRGQAQAAAAAVRGRLQVAAPGGE